jgi:isopentenyl-diphosphate delta-isomerase
MGGKVNLGDLFWDWGIPTAASLIEVRKAVGVPVIASGGLRNGLDIAKCMALGANACGMASPMLKAAANGIDVLRSFAEDVQSEIRTAMFVTGSKNIESLRRARKVITPPLSHWVG